MTSAEVPVPVARREGAHRLAVLVATLAACAVAIWVPLLRGDALGSASAG